MTRARPVATGEAPLAPATGTGTCVRRAVVVTGVLSGAQLLPRISTNPP
jgi:hypothetical protein